MRASSVITVNTGAGVEQQAIGPNNKRTRLVFMGPLAGTANLRPDSAGNVTGGMIFALTGGPLTITFEDHGDLVRSQWFVFTAGATQLGILETVH
jgi:hypothetical protein